MEITNKAEKQEIIDLTVDELKQYFFPTKLYGISQPIFHASLNYNKYKSLTSDWDTYNEVLPYIYLGRIPENNKLIISSVTYGELAEINLDYDFLEKNGIRHLYVCMEDFTSNVSNKAIINAIRTIESYQHMNNTLIRNEGYQLYVLNEIPQVLEKYRNSYIILKRQIQNVKGITINYVKSNCELELVEIFNFGPLYIQLLSNNATSSIKITEPLICSVTNHFPCHHTDNITYIHCKAGRARSGMILLIYASWVKMKNMDITTITDTIIGNTMNDIIQNMKFWRKQVDIGSNKLLKAQEILKELLYNKNSITRVYPDNAIDYLMSDLFKNDVSQLSSFKKLLTYLATLRDTQNRHKYLQEFLSQVFHTKNHEMVIEWCKFELLNKFKNASPSQIKIDDKQFRCNLVDNFTKELKCLVVHKYGCDADQIFK